MTISQAGGTGSQCATDIAEQLRRRLVGQPSAVEAIVPYIELYRAGLAPEGRPVGVFLLLGPTGTGKTRTVEALAEVLHGSEKNLLRIDCGEFQMDHEVAKLIGAPPGYLGHRETQPMISQKKLEASTSKTSSLSLVLLDEIEKAAPSLGRLLLGVLDKATLHLGDNTSVNFENSLIFMTSNLGAREMSRVMRPDFGFQAGLIAESTGTGKKLAKIGMNAVRRRFSPEFVNRIDAVITYEPLQRVSLVRILDQQIEELQRHISRRLGERAFTLEVSKRGRDHLLREGTSPEFGARELKRTLHHHLIQPLAALVARGGVEPASHLVVDYDRRRQRLEIVRNHPAACATGVVTTLQEKTPAAHGKKAGSRPHARFPDETLPLSA